MDGQILATFRAILVLKILIGSKCCSFDNNLGLNYHQTKIKILLIITLKPILWSMTNLHHITHEMRC